MLNFENLKLGWLRIVSRFLKMPLSGTQEECCLKNAESFGLNLFWYSAMETSYQWPKYFEISQYHITKRQLRRFCYPYLNISNLWYGQKDKWRRVVICNGDRTNRTCFDSCLISNAVVPTQTFKSVRLSELGKHCDIIVRADCLEAVIYHGYTQFVRFNWS